MATATRRLLPTLLKTLGGTGAGAGAGSARGLSTEKAVGAAAVVGTHTAKWMQDTSKKSPMELINEHPLIKVEGRIAACEGIKKILPLAIQSSISALIWMHLLCANTVVFVLFRTTITK